MDNCKSGHNYQYPHSGSSCSFPFCSRFRVRHAALCQKICSERSKQVKVPGFQCAAVYTMMVGVKDKVWHFLHPPLLAFLSEDGLVLRGPTSVLVPKVVWVSPAGVSWLPEFSIKQESCCRDFQIKLALVVRCASSFFNMGASKIQG